MGAIPASSPFTLLLCVVALLGGGILGSLLTWIAYQRQSTAAQAHQQAEAGSRQNEAKIKRLIEANLIGVYVADFDGRIFEANDAFLHMVGYTREELNAGQMNWAKMTPAQYVQRDQQALEEQRTTGVCTPFEKEYYRKDGSCIPVLFGCAVFDEVQHKSIGFVVDLSQQKQVEAALRQSEAKFRRFVEANLIGVAESHLDGKFFAANDAFLNMVGYSRADLDAGCMNWFEMTPPEYVQIDHQATTTLRTAGTFTPFEKEYYRKDGSRVPILVGHVVFDPVQEISIGFILDLTDRKRAEIASVLEERNRIARDIHDTLAQSFTSIIVHLEVASRKLATDPVTAQTCLQTSYELAQVGLAEARRSIAALRPQDLEQGDLYHALCLLATRIFAFSDTNLICNCQGERYSLLQTVEDHLLRIGQEALMNAYKYAEATEIQMHLTYEPNGCILYIKDNGKGFAWSDRRNRNPSDNHGFGLLGMQERAKRMGAQLTIQSTPGQGTDVYVCVNREPTHGLI